MIFSCSIRKLTTFPPIPELKHLKIPFAGETKKEENYRFDRFHGRVIFPIHSLSGQIIGFAGRILKTDDKSAKYVNSPESEIYHKSQVLYGLYLAKQPVAKQDKCYLVEGYTDVISMFSLAFNSFIKRGINFSGY